MTYKNNPLYQKLNSSNNHQALVMGILNVTPDSFSDGGQYSQFDNALHHVEKMIAEGADIIDIGGESTRPGAIKVSAEEEVDRVVPLLDAIQSRFDVCLSVDTSKSVVMAEALKLGVQMINDVRAFEGEGTIDVIKNSTCLLCTMHMQGTPQTMQEDPKYDNVVSQVAGYLKGRIQSLVEKGVSKERIVVDPGFGFGKTLEHNLSLMRHLGQIGKLGSPVLVGVSRKSMIGAVLNKEIDQRLIGSVTLAVLASQKGARILRVHDVKETVEALRMLDAVEKGA